MLWVRPPPCVTFRPVVVSLRGPGQAPVLPFACCVGSLRSAGRCGRCSCWCHFRVRGAQWLVCRGCAGWCGGRLTVFAAHTPPSSGRPDCRDSPPPPPAQWGWVVKRSPEVGPPSPPPPIVCHDIRHQKTRGAFWASTMFAELRISPLRTDPIPTGPVTGGRKGPPRGIHPSEGGLGQQYPSRPGGPHG